LSEFNDKIIGGRGSKIYNFIVPKILNSFYKKVLKDISLSSCHGMILDVGSGPGTLAISMAKANRDSKVYGIDISDDMITIAQRNAQKEGITENIQFIKADIANLPFDDKTFDLIVSTFSLHHWGRVPEAVKECYRVLRKDGMLCIYDFSRVDYAKPGKEFRKSASTLFGKDSEFKTIKFGFIPMVLKYSVKK